MKHACISLKLVHNNCFIFNSDVEIMKLPVTDLTLVWIKIDWTGVACSDL